LQSSDPIQSNPWMDPIHAQLWFSLSGKFVVMYLGDNVEVCFPMSLMCTDVCKSRIHDRRDYRNFRLMRDFRQLPWFCVTAVIITKICTISTF